MTTDGSNGLEMLGWELLARLRSTGNMLSLLDMVDQCYAAHLAGVRAGLAGQVLGENPIACDACRRAWAKGWRQGDAARRNGPTQHVTLI